jgi:hypothetical protein
MLNAADNKKGHLQRWPFRYNVVGGAGFEPATLAV